jgi:phospholipid transport system substrate-binding protein
MRKLKLLLISGLLFGGALVAAEPPKVNDSGPSQLIGSVAEAMLQALETNRAEYRRDPAKIDDLVGQIMLPHFDTQYAARLVLGRHWTAASAEQRSRFVDAFYHSMLRNYGSALVDFTPDRLKVLPYQGSADAPSATVRTQVRKNDGTMVAVNYSMRRTAEGWKAWDVVIEGVSYVKSFRDDFGSEIEQTGLDAVIRRLEGLQHAAPAGRKG